MDAGEFGDAGEAEVFAHWGDGDFALGDHEGVCGRAFAFGVAEVEVVAALALEGDFDAELFSEARERPRACGDDGLGYGDFVGGVGVAACCAR